MTLVHTIDLLYLEFDKFEKKMGKKPTKAFIGKTLYEQIARDADWSEKERIYLVHDVSLIHSENPIEFRLE